MNVVFLNQFERVAIQGGQEERAHVFIGEQQGIWNAGWRSADASETSEEDVWYEGMSWEELLAAFRHGVAGKMKQGFRPLIDGMLEETPFWERRPALPQLLQCYADMQEAGETVDKLRQWRRAKASAEKKSAYLIATNRELQMLAVFLPRTIEELLEIPGFGKAKADKYGNELIDELKDEERQRKFPLAGWVPEAVSAEQLSVWLFGLKEEKHGKALAAVREKRALLYGIRDGRTLEQLESALNCPRRALVERIEKLDEEGYDVLSVVNQELSGLSEEEVRQIESALGELGDKYLKPLLRKVYGDVRTNEQETERQYVKLRMARIRFRRTSRTAI
ncbi:HRDC domain-containing protein [Cohnella panacarvi]|uniref:HRDC domain-containing protein n=1 Tax=Cohnella panacarvi TaxID=400776 RepID=UPI00047E2DB3|nr:HRDC domain-containing protein [Cohnella panacarvi]